VPLAVTQLGCVAGGLALLAVGVTVVLLSSSIANAFWGGDKADLITRREQPDETVRAARRGFASFVTWGLRLWASGLAVGGIATLLGAGDC
jgi:hypothetical protein